MLKNNPTLPYIQELNFKFQSICSLYVLILTIIFFYESEKTDSARFFSSYLVAFPIQLTYLVVTAIVVHQFLKHAKEELNWKQQQDYFKQSLNLSVSFFDDFLRGFDYLQPDIRENGDFLVVLLNLRTFLVDIKVKRKFSDSLFKFKLFLASIRETVNQPIFFFKVKKLSWKYKKLKFYFCSHNNLIKNLLEALNLLT